MAAVNRYLWKKRGEVHGHVGVRDSRGAIWDAEGTYDGEDGLEGFKSWGMLDPDDPDYEWPNTPKGRDEYPYEVILLEGKEAEKAANQLPCPAEDPRVLLRRLVGA